MLQDFLKENPTTKVVGYNLRAEQASLGIQTGFKNEVVDAKDLIQDVGNEFARQGLEGNGLYMRRVVEMLCQHNGRSILVPHPFFSPDAPPLDASETWVDVHATAYEALMSLWFGAGCMYLGRKYFLEQQLTSKARKTHHDGVVAV